MNKITVFDLGNVLIQVDFSPFADWAVKVSQNKISAQDVLKFHKSSLYFEYEFGRLSDKEFIQRMKKLFSLHCSDDEFEDRFTGVFPGFMPDMSQLLLNLAEKNEIYALSNTNPMHERKFLKQFANELNPIKTIFMSHHIGRRKPYGGIYREITRILDRDPQSIIFFDDLLDNIDVAKQAGWDAHIFENAAQVRSICGI